MDDDGLDERYPREATKSERAMKLVGPRVLALCRRIGEKRDSTFFERFTIAPRSREDGQAAAVAAKLRGGDFIKIYSNMPRQAFFGLMERAKQQGTRVGGHLPFGISPEEASNAGMWTIEHARYPALAASDDYEAWRAAAEEFNLGKRKRMLPILPSTYRFDEKRCKEIVEVFAKNGTYLCPTHTTKKVTAKASDPEFRNDERLKYIRPVRLRAWQESIAKRLRDTPDVVELLNRLYQDGLRATGIAHANGVKILAGSDVYSPYVFPGFSFHDELVHLHQAGLSPLEVLKAATINGAECLSMSDDFGSVEAGKMADLLVLSKDPLVDVRNAREIDAFVFDGQLHERDKLDRIVKDVAAYVDAMRVRKAKMEAQPK